MLLLAAVTAVALLNAAPAADAANTAAAINTADAPIPVVAPVAAPTAARAEVKAEVKAEVTAVIDVDADGFDKNGEPAVTFKAGGAFAKQLRGKRVTWTLYVKRKLGAWTTARNYPLGETYVAAQLQELPAVSGMFLYATLAKDRFLPGEHEAAIVATVDNGKTEVFRGEVPFVLKATSFKPVKR